MAHPPKKKKKYQKPKIESEPLTAFGALCNGVLGGGRKESTVVPPICVGSKLRS